VTEQGESVSIEELVPYFQRVVEQKCTARVKESVKRLNASQTAAVAFCTDHLELQKSTSSLASSSSVQLETHDEPTISIIVGPPGCGKTTLVTSVIQVHLAASLKVMVCSPSNKAAVVGLESLLISVDPISIEDMKFALVGKHDKLAELVTGTLVGAHIPSTDPINLLASNFQQRLRLSMQCIISSWNATPRDVQQCSKVNKAVMDIMSIRLDKFYHSKDSPKEKHEALQEAFLVSNSYRVVQLTTELEMYFYSPLANYYKVTKKVVMEYVATADVVFSTLSYSALSDTENMFRVDVVIVDEAAQAFEPQVLLPLLRCFPNHLILVGDPHQLPPHLESQPLRESRLGLCMERLIKFNEMPFIQLNVQYRMHPNISRIPNLMFYNGTIQDHPSLANRDCAISGLAVTDYDFITCRCSVVNVGAGREESDDRNSKWNIQEAEMVLKIVVFLHCCGVDCNKLVSVITFYSAQVVCIQKLLREHGFFDVLVATVDSFQGSEQDYVILSYVCTANAGFVDDKNRLNVAWTRAKHLLVSVCHYDFWIENSTVVKTYLEQSATTSNSFTYNATFVETSVNNKVEEKMVCISF
jgi:energy-coupling factor transporter ATP-binding protein EcfA2